MTKVTTYAIMIVGFVTLIAALTSGQTAPVPKDVAVVALAQSAPAPRSISVTDQTTCVTAECHVDVKQHDEIHGPVSVDACNACHTIVDEFEHRFVLAREGAEMCTFCHDMNFDDALVVHAPMTEGMCTACHEPHGGQTKKFLRASSASDLCKQCHEDVIGDMAVVHGPVAAGACVACHAPHSSRYANLLSVEGPELCNSCHVTMQTQMETMRSVHEPVKRDCKSCHLAHASNHRMMLKDEPQSLCEGCHETIKHTIATATTKHAAVTGERGCMNCHEAHASDFSRMLRMNSMTLCFECHDREIKMPDGKVLGDIKAVIESGETVHGPIAQDNCAACHQIHGGDNFRLLTQEYPPEFYAPFKEENYALCFSCHDPELLRDAQTTALTNFRNGDENLHYLHVNRKKKGRTCRACHETHASAKAKHIRDAVPFGTGGWMLPINFDKTETGGSCAPGCHVAYDYDRVTPVDYQPSEEPATWPEE